MGDSTPPWTTPRSAENECLTITTYDCWYILTMSIAKVRSVSFWHLPLRILQSFSLLTVS